MPAWSPILALTTVRFQVLPAAAATAFADTYNAVLAGKTLTVSDPALGVIGNDVNIYGVKVQGTVAGLTLNVDGTFTYTGAPTSFTYCGNGATSGSACATVTLGAAALENASGITCTVGTFNSTVATTLSIKPPGVLANCKDALGYPLNVAASPAPTLAGGTCFACFRRFFYCQCHRRGAAHPDLYTPERARNQWGGGNGERYLPGSNESASYAD